MRRLESRSFSFAVQLQLEVADFLPDACPALLLLATLPLQLSLKRPRRLGKSLQGASATQKRLANDLQGTPATQNLSNFAFRKLSENFQKLLFYPESTVAWSVSVNSTKLVY